MLAFLAFATLLLAGAAEETVRCPGAFQLVGSKCYKVFRDSASYAEAQVLCRQLDSYLVSLESASEIESLSLFLARAAGDPLAFPADFFWTSGNDLQKDGVWAWRQQSQTLITQANWKNGKAPVISSSQINDKNCITLQPSSAYEWVAQKCSKAAHFVCEMSPLPVEVQPVYKEQK